MARVLGFRQTPDKSKETRMLVRPDLFRVLGPADEEEIGRIYRLALELRLRLPGFLRERRPFLPRPYSPGCHQVAHAFGRVAAIATVDGEHAIFTRIVPDPAGKEFDMDCTTMLHSWNEFSTPGGERFILDIFPDEGCAVLPVLYRSPHPAYWIPEDAERLDALRMISEGPFQTQIATMEQKMREVLA